MSVILRGTFGDYGGQYVPETLMPALEELERGWAEIKEDAGFRAELEALQSTYVGRPTPLYLAERLPGEQRVYLKREDLCHTGAHKINNAVGQALVARRLGKQRIVAETGAGQHGVASATVCARFGLGAWSTWAPRTWSARSPTSSAWACWAPRCARSSSGHAPQGGDERSDSRLDHERRDDALPDRLLRRAAPVPRARARAPVGHRA